MRQLRLDGCTVPYRERPGGGPSLILLHGAGASSLIWRRFLQAQGGGRRIAPDLPGHGADSGAPLTSMAAFVQHISAFIEALDVGPVVLCGHSLGGAIGLELAATRGDLLHSLVMVNSAARFLRNPSLAEGLEGESSSYLRAFSRVGYSPHTSPQQARSWTQDQLGAPYATLRQDFAALAGWDRRDDLPRIRTRTRLVCGEDDQITPAVCGQTLQRGLPHCTMVTIPKAGHMLPLEQPEALAGAILSGP